MIRVRVRVRVRVRIRVRISGNTFQSNVHSGKCTRSTENIACLTLFYKFHKIADEGQQEKIRTIYGKSY